MSGDVPVRQLVEHLADRADRAADVDELALELEELLERPFEVSRDDRRPGPRRWRRRACRRTGSSRRRCRRHSAQSRWSGPCSRIGCDPGPQVVRRVRLPRAVVDREQVAGAEDDVQLRRHDLARRRSRWNRTMWTTPSVVSIFARWLPSSMSSTISGWSRRAPADLARPARCDRARRGRPRRRGSGCAQEGRGARRPASSSARRPSRGVAQRPGRCRRPRTRRASPVAALRAPRRGVRATGCARPGLASRRQSAGVGRPDAIVASAVGSGPPAPVRIAHGRGFVDPPAYAAGRPARATAGSPRPSRRPRRRTARP